MAGAVTTRDGDTANLIAYQAYGFTDGATEALLAANPALIGQGPILTAGLVLTLPDLPTPSTAPTIVLWD